MLLLLALPVGVAALASAAGLLRLPYDLALVDLRLPFIFRAHMLAAGLALLLMPIAIAAHGHSVHKVVGRSAAVLSVIGGATALPAALASEASLLARAGFFMQGLLWIALVLLAVTAIRRRERSRHLWLMLMATAVASGAIWLRLSSWAAVRLDVPFDAAYALSAWLAWMLPGGLIYLLWSNGWQGRRHGVDATGAAYGAAPHPACGEREKRFPLVAATQGGDCVSREG